ncbi:MAG: hypothetical protein HQL32_16095, partial [Planctomycetes bacterium]|nr:hypothetical protein [Planctomycetota bacterium]
LELWVRGTNRPHFEELVRDEDGYYEPIIHPMTYPEDYLELPYTFFDLANHPDFGNVVGTVYSEKYKTKSLVGRIRTQLKDKVDANKVGVIETYNRVESLCQFKMWDEDEINEKAAVGGFALYGLGKSGLPEGVAGGTWKRTGAPISDGSQPITIYLKIEAFDVFDPLDFAEFKLPIDDGGTPTELIFHDAWMERYQNISSNYLGGTAKPYRLGTKYNWPVIEVNTTIGPDIP